MPTRPDFFCHYEPQPRYDLVRLMPPGRINPKTGKLKPHFETMAEAERWRQRRVEILNKGTAADKEVADHLESCGGSDGWCLSRACPTCARHHRRWIIGETLHLLEGRDNLLAPTIIMPTQRVLSGELHTLDPLAALATRKRQIERADELQEIILIGSLDLSLEVDRRGNEPNTWQLHAHAVSSGVSAKALRGALEAYYPPTQQVRLPIKIDLVRDRPRQVSYCHKSIYQRRVSNSDLNGEPKTPKYPLQDHELREVLRFLHGYKFSSFLVMKGVRRYGSELRMT